MIAEGALPESAAVLREDQAEVLAALDQLPARQREVVVLRYWMELPGADIAAAMGISVGSVKSHTARAMASLARLLKETP
jgi:RNA polymerase sigma factor (sigma-70 family)